MRECRRRSARRFPESKLNKYWRTKEVGGTVINKIANLPGHPASSPTAKAAENRSLGSGGLIPELARPRRPRETPAPCPWQARPGVRWGSEPFAGASCSAGGLGATLGAQPGLPRGQSRVSGRGGAGRRHRAGAEAAWDMEAPEPGGAAGSAAEEHEPSACFAGGGSAGGEQDGPHLRGRGGGGHAGRVLRRRALYRLYCQVLARPARRPCWRGGGPGASDREAPRASGGGSSEMTSPRKNGPWSSSRKQTELPVQLESSCVLARTPLPSENSCSQSYHPKGLQLHPVSSNVLLLTRLPAFKCNLCSYIPSVKHMQVLCKALSLMEQAVTSTWTGEKTCTNYCDLGLCMMV